MLTKRHDTIGIKQVIRIEWMKKTANLLLAGLDEKQIRCELQDLLSVVKGNGSSGKRGTTSRSQVVNILMKIWVSPNPELVGFRDEALKLLRKHSLNELAVHWSMISAAYPFWFNVALQVGRLLNLQDQVSQIQIFNRLKELYGDRETVSRYARYTVRSMVAWDVLKDSATRGCYEKPDQADSKDTKTCVLMVEAALHAIPEGKGLLGILLNNPAFFPFRIPSMTGDFISQHSNRIDVVRYGLDDEQLKLKD